MNIDHIAHAVPNIDEAIMAYKKSFNVPISEVMIIEKQNIKMAIVSFENLKIELMEPLNDKSPISKFLEKNPKGGLHHYCISVNDIKREYDEHKKSGLNVIAEPTTGYHGRNLYFIHPNELSGVLIEVEENEK